MHRAVGSKPQTITRVNGLLLQSTKQHGDNRRGPQPAPLTQDAKRVFLIYVHGNNVANKNNLRSRHEKNVLSSGIDDEKRRRHRTFSSLLVRKKNKIQRVMVRFMSELFYKSFLSFFTWLYCTPLSVSRSRNWCSNLLVVFIFRLPLLSVTFFCGSKFYFSARPEGDIPHTTLNCLLSNPWSHVSPLLPPSTTCLHFYRSQGSFSISSAGSLSSIFAKLRFRAFR